MAIARSLRSTGITPLHHYKETGSPPQLDSDDAAMSYEGFIRMGRNCQMPSTSIYCAGRRMTPSGTTPSRTSRHKAIKSLRAKATIMSLRVPRAFSVRARNPYRRLGRVGPGNFTPSLSVG